MMRRHGRWIALTLLGILAAPGCRTWDPHGWPWDTVAGHVRVELESDRRVELVDARMERDTLVGRYAPARAETRIPRDRIRSVESSRLSWPRTVLAVVGPLAGSGLISVAVTRTVKR